MQVPVIEKKFSRELFTYQDYVTLKRIILILSVIVFILISNHFYFDDCLYIRRNDNEITDIAFRSIKNVSQLARCKLDKQTYVRYNIA